MDAIAAADVCGTEACGTADGVTLHFRDIDLLQGSPASLASRLQYAKTQAGYTQSGLTVLVGISRARIAHIESGNERTPSSSVITTLAAALSVAETSLHHGGNAETEADEVDGPAERRLAA